MANKLPSREDLFNTFDSVDSPADYSKAVGSLMLENQKTSSKLRRWSIFFLIILLLLAALAAAAFQSMYQNYRSNQIVAEIKKDPLGEIKVSSSDIAVNSIDFNQLNSSLKARIVNIDNSVTNLGGQIGSVSKTIEDQPLATGGTVTSVNTGAGLTGGPITGTGLIAVNAPTCTSNQRLSWDGANFRCVGVLGTGTVGANTFFAGPTSGSGAPSYRAIVAGDLSGALSSTGPVIYNDTTGDISCPTCITSVGTAFVASADSGSDQPLNIGDTLSLLGGDGISTVASTGNEVTFNLTDTGITPATYGSASSVPTFTVDSKGRLTSASSTAIAINASAITSGTLSVTRGGTGVDGSSASNGQLLIGNGSGYSLATLTGAGPVGITNSAGGISIGCSTCVTTSGNGNITSSGGDITLGGTTTGRLIGSGNVNYDLSTTGVVGATYGSANQVATFTVDSKGRLTGAGSTTISGLTSSNLSGAAAITNAQLQNSALTISSGNGLSGGGSISLGGSSSLAISAPTCLTAERLSWNGSAFICSAVAGAGSEAANTFFAGPTSGGAATPTFRGIVTADLGSGTANNQSFLRGDQTWFQLLDGGGKIDSSLLPSNGLNLQGSWNANTNSPALADGGTGGVQGDFYIVNTAGTTSVDGSSTWNIGDWILHNGTTWERITNTNAVSSVNGNTGAVVLDTDDVSEGAGNLYFTNARARGAISGSGPISYNSGSGVIDCPTCVTTSGNGNIVVGTGASISGTLTGRLIGAGNVTFGVSSSVPTSVVNDTNVTGSISANALTLGWTGQLSASRGGTGVDGSSASNGQLLIGNGSGYSLATLTGAGPVGITNSAGGISIGCSTCVTTSGNGNITSSGGDITLGGTTTGRLIGSGNVNYDLSTTGVVGATYGSANQVATFTVDSKGRLTGAGSTSIAINASAITSGSLSVTRGGTGVDGSGATNGQLLIGNGSGYSLSTVASSGPIGITNSAGGISVGCSTCVTTGTTLFSAAGSLGPNQSVTSGQTVTFVGGVGLTTTASTGRNITVDLDDTAVTAASYGTASSVGSFTVDAQGRITNASNTAIAISASAITSGTLSVTRGGTGVDGSGATNGQLLIGNGSGYSLSTLSAGSGISVTNSAGGISIANTGAAATCGATTNYVCNNGNTLGAALNIGTTDANILTLGTGNTTRFTVSSGAATLTGNGATTLTSSGAMTLNSASATALGIDSGTTGTINIGTGANSKTINIGNTTGTTGINIDSGSGNINLRPGGSGTTANVQIGAGGAGSTTPDLLVLDSKSDAGDPTGTNGALYYNASSGKFRCYENGTWKDCIGGGGLINLGHSASYDTSEVFTNVAASQVTLGTVSVTPSTASGDVYVTGQADVYSSNNTDQTFVFTIETGSTCTGTTVATRTYTITSGLSTTVDRGSLVVSGVVSNPGASSQAYSLCASTATGDTDVENWHIEALVVDSSAGGSTGNPSADSVSDTSVTSPTPGSNPTFGTEIEILNPTNPTITPDTTSQRIYITGGVQFTGTSTSDDTDTTLRVRIRRGSGSCAGTQVGPDITATMTDPLQSIWVPFSIVDSPATASAQAYTVCAATRDGDGAAGSNATTPTVMMTIQEIAASGADLAETYYTHDNAEAGDVVSIDASMKAGVRKSNKAYDSLVLGVVSTKPGYTLSDPEGTDPSARPVDIALSGRVPVKVSDENGQIKVGDALAPSSTPGVAMKATDTGWVIGVAMEDQTSSKSTILTYVNRSWYTGGSLKAPSLTGLTMTDGSLAGIEKEQINQMQDGLSSNNPELVSQALGILKDIQGTVVGQQTKFNELEARLNSQQVAQAVFNGGVITEDSTFKGKVVFEALTTFNSGIVFNGDTKFAGNTSFDKVISQTKDQAGIAVIPAGSTKVSVAFSAGAYNKSPIVTATPIGEEALLDLKYSITDVSENGFSIIIKPEQAQDARFNYIVAQTQ